jgi:uncharacterized protein YdaU (DUF1376 family)
MYWADYLGDTTQLSTVEHGAYLLLIGSYWLHLGLPNDDEKLRKIVKATPKQWQKLRPVVSAFFNAEWKHKRIERMLAKVAEKSRKNAENGRCRWNVNVSRPENRGQKFNDFNGRPERTLSDRLANGMLPKLKERKTVLTSEPREASANFAVGRGGGLEGFDPSAAMRAKLVEAANGNVSAKAAEDVSPITRLRAKGCSLEKHILPAIAELVPKLEAPLRSWADPTLVAEILKRQEGGLGEGRERVPLREGDTDPVAASLERLAKGRANGAVELDVRSAPDALDSSVPDGTVLS